MPLYTQILARTVRPNQALGALSGLTVYTFPPTPEGTVICEKTSETIDLRILIQVAKGISWKLGPRCAVLALAGDEKGGFWCGLFAGGDLRFRHNRLAEAREITGPPAALSEVELLCGYFSGGLRPDAVDDILSLPYESAEARHAALAAALGLPSWSPGLGYARAAAGIVPPDAGMPRRPPQSLRELRPDDKSYEVRKYPNAVARFQDTCARSFKFLEKDLGFQKEAALDLDQYPEVSGNPHLIGDGHLRPGYGSAFMMSYRSPLLTVMIEGLSYGGRTRLCLIDRHARLLDLTKLVERRDPGLLDLCLLADGQNEAIPIYAEALRTCASEVLAGDFGAISLLDLEKRQSGFSFTPFDRAEHLREMAARIIGVQRG
jgi:hypothetical protein